MESVCRNLSEHDVLGIVDLSYCDVTVYAASLNQANMDFFDSEISPNIL